MNYIEWLKQQFEPRKLSVEEIEEENIDLRPLDFVEICSWSDLETVAIAKARHDPDCAPAERFCDIQFVECIKDADTYESGTVAVVPYHLKNDTPHGEMKTALTEILNENDWSAIEQ